jgi:hypothetical protein
VEPNASLIEEVIFDLKKSEYMELDGIKLSLLKHYMVDVVPSIFIGY